jgi:hypothetical protein
LASRLPFLPAHDSLYLLRNVLTAPRLVYLLRTAPCTGSAVLQQYDALLRQTVTTTLNVDLSDRAWSQATLPVRWGGIGIRDVVSLAPSAYLASAASTMDLVTRLLPPRLHGTIDSGYEVAFASWSLLTGSIQSSIHSSQSSSQSQLHPMAQRSWDEPCCQTRADELLNTATDQVDRARLLASRSEGSGDWLGALPLSCIGLKMDNAATRIAVGLRLGSPLVRGHKCVCGTAVSVDGHHGLACRKSAGRHSRHNQVNDILYRAFVSAGVLATREPTGLCVGGGKRPDGVSLVPWSKGRCLAWDATCPDTFAPSHIQSSSVSAGAVAAISEAKKCAKYAGLPADTDFCPVAVETTGVWGEEGLALVKELGRRIALCSFEPRSTLFLRQRISLAIQRGNAYCILATLPPSPLDIV